MGGGWGVVRAATVGDAAAVARVHVDSWRATYRGIVPQAHLDGLRYADREASWRRQLTAGCDGPFTLVAEDTAGEVFGFASAGRERSGDLAHPGELWAIYLLQPAQRHGVGRALVAAAAEKLAQRGMTAMLLWVLAENRNARGFYERLGGSVVRQRAILIGGVPLDEVAYGWVDTAALRLPAEPAQG